MRVLIEFERKPLLFENPVGVVICHDPAELAESLAVIERCLDGGFFAAGFLSYEAGYALEPRLRDLGRPGSSRGFPLLAFGLFRSPVSVPIPFSGRTSFQLGPLESSVSRAEYAAGIQHIRSCIEQGEVYQITYCRKLKFGFSGDPYRLYRMLLREQPVPYPAYLEADRYRILSLSPELFLRKTGTRAVTKPMKGSWPCGEAWWQGYLAGVRLGLDPKNRAENVMIADLLRNDLGRVGTHVSVPRLFEVARYRTICQMTSTVTAQLPVDIPLGSLLGAVFPSGSVTGAPKVRAMEIIAGLEPEERKIHTGTIGFITPGRDFFFNVPIRTILLEGGQGEMGIGGGVVWDSTVEGEWAEGEWKARFLTGIL